ncbi:MAG: biopolymer transporter ExbD [Bacteroidetes bacterium]|nr:biopolymer transporter ExbD [Bacteroidota bacterium]MBU1115081.1 biopolymer transporter ExbD [Bacteroidota bacterium]MBU1799001.1 biopolymer transporter ExbD [Bacteroidota bacterium]
MVQIKKKKERDAKIPDAGMSDIVFLLLLFFLVSTTIDVDTGIGLSLPEYIPIEEQVFVPLSKDRLAALNINENGDVLLDGEIIAIPQISETLKPRIESKVDLPSTKKLVVSVKTDRKTNYNLYIQALDQIKFAYAEVQSAYAQQAYGKKLLDLTPEEANIVKKEKVPIIISIAEPEKIK